MVVLSDQPDGANINADCGSTHMQALCEAVKRCGCDAGIAFDGDGESNLGLSIAAKQNGFSVKQTAVGDRYVLEQMLKTGEILGGEQSGHVIFLNHNTTGDGLVSALKLLEILKRSGKTMSSLAQVMQVLPQVIVNAKVDNEKKKAFHTHTEIQAEIEKTEQQLKGEGRVLIRPSGTEPLIRVMLEGKDLEFLQKEAQRLADFIIQALA